MHKQQDQTQATDVTCLIQRECTYQEQPVILVLDQHQVGWVNIPSACRALGLNVRGQQQRIGRNGELVSRHISITTRGGPQRITCLHEQSVSLWLRTLAQAQPETFTSFLEMLSGAFEVLRKEILPPSYSLLLPLDGEDASPGTQDVITTTLPGLGQILVVPSHAEDRAVREAAFARPKDWHEEPHLGLPYYLASNQMRVYIGDPDFPLEQDEAQAAIKRLRETTVLTARYVLGRWNIAREQGLLAQEGSVPVRIEEILEWRGLQRHSRAVFPGSDVRRVEGFEVKYRVQAQEDLRLLSQLYLQGTHHILVEGQWRPVTIDGFYMRLGHLQNPENDRALFFVAPGVWINTYELSGLWLAELDRRLFQLHPQQDQIALRIGLYLSEYWQLHFMAGQEIAPLSMSELLQRSMVPIDHNHLTTRFISRVENALKRLLSSEIVGAVKPEREVPLDRPQWGKEWLSILWRLNPSLEMLTQQRQRPRPVGMERLSPLLLSASGPGASTQQDARHDALHAPSGQRTNRRKALKRNEGAERPGRTVE